MIDLRPLLRAVTAALALAAAPFAAHADSLLDYLGQGRFDGQLRAYYFRRDYAAETVPNASAFALAGIFDYRSAPFLDGFGFGASYFTANALDTHERNSARIDATLSGTANSINALGQAFVQYEGHRALVRLGDQMIDTPWAGPSDGRVLPATYQGAFASFAASGSLTLNFLRILRFKNRTADGYFRDNNYYPPTWRGDSSYGGAGVLPADAPGTAGTTAAGVDYHHHGAKVSGWYYDFAGFAQMLYAQGEYMLPLDGSIQPFAGAQLVREWGRAGVFADTGTRLFHQPGSEADNLTTGLILGVKRGGMRMSIAYDRVARRGANALGGGALISPYSASFSTDPLYTTSMIRGLVELGPGSAWKLSAATEMLERRLALVASFARYTTHFNAADTEAYFDVTYLPKGWARGLSLRNRFEIGNGPVNPGRRHFIYNRMQVVYSF